MDKLSADLLKGNRKVVIQDLCEWTGVLSNATKCRIEKPLQAKHW